MSRFDRSTTTADAANETTDLEMLNREADRIAEQRMAEGAQDRGIWLP